MLEYKHEREGTHFVAVNPRETEDCASCGVSTDKPSWVREHSRPACGFEADRDANAVVRLHLTGSKREAFATAWNVLSRGIKKRLGEGRSESTSSESLRDSDVRTRALLSLASPEREAFWCLGNQRFPMSPQELRSCEMRTNRRAIR